VGSWKILRLMKVFTSACVLSLAATLTTARADGTNKAAPKPDLSAPASLTEKAPESFKARFETSKGSFTVEVTRSLSPNGADRFYNLVRAGYFTDVEFFRVISGFMCQFGIHGDPKVSAAWREARIPDDPVKASNTLGAITFATAGPNTRTTQLFINFADNKSLDGMGFSPFGKVIGGMEVVDQIYSGYGEGAPRGLGPDQGRVQQEGNAYLKKEFPKLDYIKSAVILP
jgi:peptidyl-prolyl cis-trans isomerase A (cyclophilin A)